MINGPDDFHVACALRFNFKASNNEAEYEALIAGLRMAQTLKIQKLVIHSDSQLVVNQVLGDFEAREPRMIRYLEVVKTLLQSMPGATLQYVPREENAQADALSRVATADFPHLL